MPAAEVPQQHAGAVLLDVREDDEWQQGHAPGAIHIPMGEVPSRLADLGVDGDLFVVCRSGGRSARVVEYLLHAGVDAVNVDGGMVAWQQAGMPIVDGAGQPASVY
ncbi:MAG: rhodanese-like domain-containing protein [Rhodococcus sp. (in: high G+C Gram-positive bacteria)]